MTTTKTFRWDPAETAEVREALSEYERARREGYAVCRQGRRGRVQLHRFENTGEFLFVPALQGG